MKRLWIIVSVLITWSMLAVVAPTSASPPSPQTSCSPPRPPEQELPPPETETPPDLAALNLPPLKAVLVVGPIDGDTGSWTNEAKADMNLAADELAANGVSVQKFYTPDDNWDDITAAAQGAHFFFYRGHGVYLSPMPTPNVGGFSLSSGIIAPAQVRRDLHLAPNAIVMMYGCFTAGTAGNDSTSIGSAEAQRRVAQYSDPFLEMGVAGYYANWFGDAFQMYVRYLFEGQTLGEAYESFYDFNTTTVERHTHPEHPEHVMWLDNDYWSGMTQYNNAFVGAPDRTLVQLFGQGSSLSDDPNAQRLYIPLVAR
jgi:hypothetical protein